MPDKNILSLVADNPALYEALRELFEDCFSLDTLYDHKTDTLSNEQLGAILRARLDGLAVVDEAFQKIAQFVTIPANPQPRNPAR
jgi:hypothetical protein